MAESEKFTLALPTEGGPAALAQQAVLQQLVREDEAANNWYSAIGDLPVYQTVRTQDAVYRGQLALAALATIRANGGRVATTMVKLLGTLMRSTVALEAADFVALFLGLWLAIRQARCRDHSQCAGHLPSSAHAGAGREICQEKRGAN